MFDHLPSRKSRTSLNIGAHRVLIASTAMLAFISFWRAAAVVLNDMGSSAFYAGAIAEHFVGKTAPWFVLAIMLLSYAVRAVYIESSSMFVRGGVYRVVKEAMGATLAKFSVSALMFDYILTGPISGVSAGLYLAGLLNDLLHYAHSTVVLPTNGTAAFFAVLVTLYFWWENIKGIPESSEKSASHHVRDHGHGAPHAGLVLLHPLGARSPSSAFAAALESSLLKRCSGLVAPQLTSLHGRSDRHISWARSLGSCHEW
jgi:amino acid transporter